MNLGQSLLEYEKRRHGDEPIAQMIEELNKRPDITSRLKRADTAINDSMLDLYRDDENIFSVRFEHGKWFGSENRKIGRSIRYIYESILGMMKVIERWSKE
jgi:hypothetical protein